jgi:hypothetical protein
VIVVTGGMLVEHQASIDDGFSKQAPLVYHLGHTSPTENSALFETISKNLAQNIQERMAFNEKGKFDIFFSIMKSVHKINSIIFYIDITCYHLFV